MKIDRKLNIVVPVDTEDGKTVYVHSAPIGREVFETYFLPLSKTFAAIYAEGLGSIAGPRIASLMLKRVAGDMGVGEEVERGLLAEIRRLTNLVMQGEQGWETVPFQLAVDRKMLDADDMAEIENALVYFTVASSMHKRKDLGPILDGALKLWSGSTSSLDCTEFAASLTTSTKVAGTGKKPAASSVPC